MKTLDLKTYAGMGERWRQPYHANYYAMFSSVVDAIVTDPLLMMVPVDDHMVHRGDGVFETLKCLNGQVYALASHLERLAQSAAAVGLAMPYGRTELRDLVLETLRAGGQRDALVRVLVSRGPGSMGVAPGDCPAAQVYILAYRLPPAFMEAHPGGATLRSSRIAPKDPWLARIKSCNYLQNVLMKQEAVEAGVDFVVGFDQRGWMTESATENVGIVTAEGDLVFPELSGILSGTTMLRSAQLARALTEEGLLQRVLFKPIPRQRVEEAAEILIFGTTPDVTAVIAFDGRPVGGGVPGPVQKRLSALLQEDLRTNNAMLTAVWPSLLQGH